MGTTHHVLSEKPPVTMPSYLEMVSHEHRFSKKGLLYILKRPRNVILKPAWVIVDL